MKIEFEITLLLLLNETFPLKRKTFLHILLFSLLMITIMIMIIQIFKKTQVSELHFRQTSELCFLQTSELRFRVYFQRLYPIFECL